MALDLRKYIQQITPELCRIDNEISAYLETSIIVNKLEKKKRRPVICFTNVLTRNKKPSPFPLITNLFADKDRLYKLFEKKESGILTEYNRRYNNKKSPVITNTPPVKECVMTGKNLHLDDLPFVTHHEKDAGPYITSGIVIVKDPEDGTYNGAIQRLQVHENKTFSLYMAESGDNKAIYDKYSKAKKNTPAVIVIGHHPLFYLGMQYKSTPEDDEYEVTGGIMNEALEVTGSITIPDFFIPARAEIILEGEILADYYRKEAPFGEYSHYYCSQRESNVVKINALLKRNNAYYHDIMPCHSDHHYLEGFTMEAQLDLILRERFPSYQALTLPLSGCCQLFCYISIRKTDDTEPLHIARRLLASQEYLKYIIVVDDDIDIHDEAEVWWAIATRAGLSTGLIDLSDIKGTEMIPGTGTSKKKERWLLDATIPLAGEFPERTGFPPLLYEKITLKEYGL